MAGLLTLPSFCITKATFALRGFRYTRKERPLGRSLNFNYRKGLKFIGLFDYFCLSGGL